MSMKIMITGKNRKIALDIDEHLHDDRDYTLIKCAASKAALLDMSLSETPDVIIICAGDENADSVKVFDILRESVRLGAIEVIVVANEEDRKCFMANTKLDRLFFLSRPISLLALYKKLDDIAKTIRTKERPGLQDHDRSLCGQAGVHPGLFRHLSDRHHRHQRRQKDI